jgi:hypothetical protein
MKDEKRVLKIAEGCDPDDRACATALLTLVDEVMRLRVQRAKVEEAAGTPVSFNVISGRELMETRWPDANERLVADPLMEALHGAVKQLGRYLFRMGGTARMERVAELACEQRPKHYSRYGSYIDHRLMASAINLICGVSPAVSGTPG